MLRRAQVPDSQVGLACWPFPSVQEQAVEIPYCDNVSVVGVEPGQVQELRDRVVDTFRRHGFDMHEISDVSRRERVLGGDLGGPRPRMPLYALANDNWIGRERIEVREASEATRWFSCLGRVC